jgi:arginase family enzyme
MHLADFLSPVKEDVFNAIADSSPRSLVNVFDIHVKSLPDYSTADIVLIGVKEHRRNDSHTGCALAPDEIRKQLYRLVVPKYNVSVCDLGNIAAGDTLNDTLFALSACVKEVLLSKNAATGKSPVVIILGGTQDLAYAQYTAYQGINPNLNVVAADPCIDLRLNEQAPANSGYLYKMISHQPNYLFNIAHIGNQNYFVEQESLDSFEKMNFDITRLGSIRNQIQETEPLLRNADMFVLSMNSVRASDSPASMDASPNGFFGEEACQVARYAGMSNELTSFGIYDLNSTNDSNSRSAKLASQMLWYFIDGFYNRKNDYPVPDNKDYMMYRTSFMKSNHEIVFYKNIYTERWWMEVPYPKERSEQQGKFLVPCSYKDYQSALSDEIPDRWMKAYQKLL